MPQKIKTMKEIIIDSGEINLIEENFFHIRQTTATDSEWLVAIRVLNGKKNECQIIDFHTKFAVEIVIKKCEEYYDEIKFPIRKGIDTSELFLKFRLKNNDGVWKSGLYWVVTKK